MAGGRRSRRAVRVALAATAFARSPSSRPPAHPAARGTRTRSPTPRGVGGDAGRDAAGQPARRPVRTGAEGAAHQSDPLDAAAARARRITDATREWASFTLADRRAGRQVGDSRTDEVTNSEVGGEGLAGRRPAGHGHRREAPADRRGSGSGWSA